jgi:hypothetical protein
MMEKGTRSYHKGALLSLLALLKSGQNSFGPKYSLILGQSAMTAFKSKSGFGKSQRFFFKSIGDETVDGPRLLG